MVLVFVKRRPCDLVYSSVSWMLATFRSRSTRHRAVCRRRPRTSPWNEQRNVRPVMSQSPAPSPCQQRSDHPRTLVPSACSCRVFTQARWRTQISLETGTHYYPQLVFFALTAPSTHRDIASNCVADQQAHEESSRNEQRYEFDFDHTWPRREREKKDRPSGVAPTGPWGRVLAHGVCCKRAGIGAQRATNRCDLFHRLVHFHSAIRTKSAASGAVRRAQRRVLLHPPQTRALSKWFPCWSFWHLIHQVICMMLQARIMKQIQNAIVMLPLCICCRSKEGRPGLCVSPTWSAARRKRRHSKLRTTSSLVRRRLCGTCIRGCTALCA